MLKSNITVRIVRLPVVLLALLVLELIDRLLHFSNFPTFSYSVRLVFFVCFQVLACIFVFFC